ncbi:MFS transporter [Roseibium salinum]|uniref:MFS transporter n=1 Tax=Roseibium salinum TaxID=1604349 RepID=A0ABT3QXD9_9HYPH|nr:MFS transporter [Roseibium sp. DSM 29163]MCX2721516.1 MFS transporter [Roseibium sp. DSM 29163]
MMDLLRDRRAVALLLAASLTILSNATISPALPGIEARFSGTPDAALLTRLLVTAPALMVALCAPIAGMAADRFGRRRLLLAGVLLFSLAGSAGMVLPDLHLILASRLVLGIAVAFVMTSQAALVGDLFQGAARGRFMGYQMAATNFGGFVFVAFAGWLAGFDVFLVFALYAVGLLYLPFLWRAFPAERPAADNPAEGLTSDDGGADTWIPQLTFLAALAGGTFVIFYMVPTQVPFYLNQIGHTDPAASGAVIAAVPLAAGCAAFVFGPLRKRLGRGGAPALGFLVMAAGFWLLQSAMTLPALTVAVGLIGGGFGWVMPGFITSALDVAPAGRRGLASGAITTSIFLGQFASPIAVQPLVETLGYVETYRITALVLVGLSAIAAIGLRPPRSSTVRFAE